MTSLALAAATGGATPLLVLNPAAGIALGIVANYIDQRYIMPKLFPTEPVEGPRLQEMQIQGADEGAPMNRCYSQKTRVAGTIIWTSLPREVKTSEDVGGKGGGQEVDSFSYYMDVAIAFCEEEIQEVSIIYADTEVLYKEDPTVALSGNDITATIETESYWDEETQTNVIVKVVMKLTAPDGGTDLSECVSGVDADIDGFTETDYNGTFRCIRSNKSSSGVTAAKFELPLTASTTGEAAGNTITVDQEPPQFDSSQVGDVTIYLGTETQTPDPTIEAIEGTDEVPAYRGIAYAVLSDLNVTDGFRVPNLQAQISRGSADDLEDVVVDIMARTDLSALQYDATALAGEECLGYVVRGPQPTVGMLQPLLLASDVLTRETNDVIEFFLRENAVEVTVDPDDLAAHEERSRDVSMPHELRDRNAQKPPAEVLVKYIDTENRLQPGEQRERRINVRSTTEKAQYDFGISMDGGRARDIAAKILWTSWTGRREITVQLPPSMLEVQENDVVVYTYLTETYKVLIDSISEGVNWIRQMEGQQELLAHMSHSSPHEPPEGSPGEGSTYVPYDTILVVMDVAPLRTEDVTKVGIYIATDSRQQDVAWGGAVIYESTDGGTTFGSIRKMNTSAAVGVTESTLGAGTGRAQWDRGSTLTVVLEDGEQTLSSRQEIDVLNGANRAVVGGEVIAFSTAVLAGSQPNDGRVRYELSDLLRGLVGTEDRMGSHATGDAFVYLNSPGVEFHELGVSAAGSNRQYKSVAPGGDPDTYTAIPAHVAGNTVKPPGPVHLHGTRASNIWTLTWIRRSRQWFRVFSQAAPLLDTEDYEVDIYNDAGTAVVRTITSTASANGSVVDPDTQSATYDDDDQTADFGSVKDSIKFRVYQMSDLVGRGKASELITVSINS